MSIGGPDPEQLLGLQPGPSKTAVPIPSCTLHIPEQFRLRVPDQGHMQTPMNPNNSRLGP